MIKIFQQVEQNTGKNRDLNLRPIILEKMWIVAQARARISDSMHRFEYFDRKVKISFREKASQTNALYSKAPETDSQKRPSYKRLF